MMSVKLMLVLFSLMLCAGPSWAEDEREHSDATKEHGAEQFEGISIEIPKKTQDLISLKTQKVEVSLVKEKIPIMGRVVQDAEHTTEVLAVQDGTLKTCQVQLADSVVKGQTLCTMDSNGEIIELKAPADGVIMGQLTSIGEPVDTVSPVFLMVSLSKLVAAFDIYERDIQKIQTNQKVQMFASAFPDKVFEGRIVFVSPRLDDHSFTFKIRVEINNHDLLLRPGMFLQGDVLIQDQQAHLIVPIDAVQNVDGESMVFIQDEPESFTSVKVDMQLASHKQAFIKGDLKAGDVIVTDGSYMIKSKLLESEITGGCSH